jgi:hypothetical protein
LSVPALNQSSASAGGDIVGGNKTTTTIVLSSIQEGSTVTYPALERWIEELRAACELDLMISYHVRSFELYTRKRAADDGIEGLINKLNAANRGSLVADAIEQKVHFEKLLDEWSYYASAQEIFAYLLAKIRRGFSLTATPNIGLVPEHIIDQLVDKDVLLPLVDECSKIPQFSVNLDVALGMLYWLADQCFLRWHK